MKTTTKQALSGLDFAIAQCTTRDRMPDEFTLAEYIVRTRINRHTAEQQLARLVAQGLLTKRKISIDGSLTNLYRKP
jgi:DNA-binding GntR family transcriptional regulator